MLCVERAFVFCARSKGCFHSGGYEHFITCSCYHRQPLLASAPSAGSVSQNSLHFHLLIGEPRMRSARKIFCAAPTVLIRFLMPTPPLRAGLTSHRASGADFVGLAGLGFSHHSCSLLLARSDAHVQALLSAEGRRFFC